MASYLPTQFQTRDGRNLMIRSAEPEDAKAFDIFIRQIPHESNHTLQYIGKTYPPLEEVQKRLLSMKMDPFTLQLLVFDQIKVVGLLNVRKWGIDDNPCVAHSARFGMMILKDYWCQGLGKKLLQLQDEYCRSKGIIRIEAEVRVENEAGVKLYTSQGYQIEGRMRKGAKIEMTCIDGQFVGGRFVDNYYIAKLLDEPLNQWLPPEIQTDRLLLRPLFHNSQKSDAASIFEYACLPEVSRYTLWEPHQSIEDSIKFIVDYVQPNYRKSVPEALGICLKDNPGKVIGTVGCFWVSPTSKVMEMGYALSPHYWGQGLMPEAARAVMSYCREEFKLKRIQARCKVENKSSRKVMEKIGMTYEGTLRSSVLHRDRYWDIDLLAMVF